MFWILTCCAFILLCSHQLVLFPLHQICYNYPFSFIDSLMFFFYFCACLPLSLPSLALAYKLISKDYLDSLFNFNTAVLLLFTGKSSLQVIFFLLIPDQLNYCTFKSITYSKPIFCPAQKDINSKIVEKGKIMNLLNCFRSPVMNQNRFKDFCVRF